MTCSFVVSVVCPGCRLAFKISIPEYVIRDAVRQLDAAKHLDQIAKQIELANVRTLTGRKPD